MIEENAPAGEENATDSKPDTVPMVATGEATPAEPVATEPMAAETTSDDHQPMTPTKETERELEPETPKPAKKPRKSSKSAAASEETPTKDTPKEAVAAKTASGDAPSENAKKWYVVKVQSGREDSIKAAIERKVKIEGLEEFFGQIAIPVEEIIQKKSVRVTDKKTGDKVTQEKKVIKHQKKFPGYLFAEVEYNDRILYLFRETSGVGDFVGASLKREPTPMTDREVRAMISGVADGDPGKPNQKQKVKLDYEKGDKVKIRDGAFANMEGIVKSITETKDTGETPKVKVEVTIFGRPVEVDLDYWHVDKA
jgi:transcriptional antiterminator NusG